MNPQTPPGDRRTQRFFGSLLMAVGGLIATLCGLCSLGSLLAGLFSFVSYGLKGNFGAIVNVIANLGIWVVVVAIVGGLPTMVGVLLFRAGLRRYRPPAKKIDAKIFE